MKKTLPLPVLISISILIVFIIFTQAIDRKYLIYNKTNSMPIGFYTLDNNVTYSVNDVVYFPIPNNIKRLVADRKYLSDYQNLMKPIAAKKGDNVCIKDKIIYINDEIFSTVDSTDSKQRNLPIISLCRDIKDGEYFVAVKEHSNSLDSRYFGLLEDKVLLGKVNKLWIF